MTWWKVSNPMKNVTIRFCKIWLHNRFFATRVAAFVKNETGIEVELDSTGKIGEFTVWVDGELVETKDQLKFPDKDKILHAIKKKL
jgi:hypothetical protein